MMSDQVAGIPADDVTAGPAEVLPGATDAQGADAAGQADQGQEQQQEKKEPEKTPEWVQRRIDRATAKRYEAQARADQAERHAAELEARLAAYERPQGDDQQQAQLRPEDVHALAERIADAKVQAQTFNRAADALVGAGEKEYGADFKTAVVNLGSIGALFKDNGAPTDFTQAIIECDNAHRVLYHLGQHPDEADAIIAMAPRAQARALAKLEARLEAAPPVTSKAPPPVRTVGSRSGALDTATEKDSTAEWMKKENARMRAAGIRY